MKVCEKCKSPYLQKVIVNNKKVITCLVCGNEEERQVKVFCDCPVCDCDPPCGCECCDCDKEDIKEEYPLC